MPNWYWIVYLIVGVFSFYVMLKLQKQAGWIAVIVGIAEAILAYIFSVTAFDMRIHSANIKISSYIIVIACAVLMVGLFFIKSKPKNNS